MGTIAEIELPADEFALHETFEQLPEVEFEIARVAAHGHDRAMPLTWASSEGLDGIDDAFDADPTVDNVRTLADLDNERLYQMDWIDQIDFIVHVLVEQEGTVLSAEGTRKQWHLRILFPTRDSLSSTFQFSQDEGLTLDIQQVYELEETERGGQYGLTEGQFKTLVSAHEHGYYDIPREVTQEELAEILGISRQALSERFRRGHGHLVENTLVIGSLPGVEST